MGPLFAEIALRSRVLRPEFFGVDRFYNSYWFFYSVGCVLVKRGDDVMFHVIANEIDEREQQEAEAAEGELWMGMGMGMGMRRRAPYPL
jgi:hypothetical protein